MARRGNIGRRLGRKINRNGNRACAVKCAEIPVRHAITRLNRNTVRPSHGADELYDAHQGQPEPHQTRIAGQRQNKLARARALHEVLIALGRGHLPHGITRIAFRSRGPHGPTNKHPSLRRISMISSIEDTASLQSVFTPEPGVFKRHWASSRGSALSRCPVSQAPRMTQTGRRSHRCVFSGFQKYSQPASRKARHIASQRVDLQGLTKSPLGDIPPGSSPAAYAGIHVGSKRWRAGNRRSRQATCH